MSMVAIEDPLRESIGNEAVDSLIRLINRSQDDQKKDILEIVEEKFERRLSEEISNLKVTLLEKINEVDTRLFKEMTKNKADLIKWMFLFWAGQLAVILGVLFAFFKS